MVTNEENIFFKKTRKRKIRVGKAWGASLQWGMPVGTQLHQGSLIMFYVFGHFSDLFLTLFNTQKDFFLVKLEHSEMSCPFVKKVTCITILKRIEKKKIEFFKVMCSSLKLGAFNHAFPLFLEQVKITHSFPKKERKKK